GCGIDDDADLGAGIRNSILAAAAVDLVGAGAWLENVFELVADQQVGELGADEAFDRIVGVARGPAGVLARVGEVGGAPKWRVGEGDEINAAAAIEFLGLDRGLEDVIARSAVDFFAEEASKILLRIEIERHIAWVAWTERVQWAVRVPAHL